MKDLMIILSAALPIDRILDELESAIKDYKSNPEKDALSKVEMFCLLLMSKKAAEANEGGTMGILKELDDLEHVKDFLKPDKRHQ